MARRVQTEQVYEDPQYLMEDNEDQYNLDNLSDQDDPYGEEEEDYGNEDDG